MTGEQPRSRPVDGPPGADGGDARPGRPGVEGDEVEPAAAVDVEDAEGVADVADVADGRSHERRRRRAPGRILAVGAALSLVASLLTGLLGVPGRVGGAVFLSLLSLTTGVAGATVAVGMVVDQYRGVRVTTGRVLLTGGLLLLTLLLLVAAAGATLDAARAGP